MFRPLECFVGLRYVRARAQRGFVSFVSLASLAGIGLGVAALIVILSVMNGFESELRSRLLSIGAHASLSSPREGIAAWPLLAERVSARPEVAAVAPFTALEGMLASSGANLSPAMVRGVAPAEEAAVADLERLFIAGSLDDLQPGARRIALGRFLAARLGVGVGDRVQVLAPAVEEGRLTPRLAGFVVSGVFQAGIQEHDAGLALIHLDEASRLKGLGARPESLGIRLRNPLAARDLREALQRDGEAAQRGGTDLEYTDWILQNRSYFRAINIEKAMMTVLLLLIVAVAAFNVVASLTMTVTDRHKDIAILRTLGLDAGRVARIFVVQGSILGIAGTAIGVVLGMVLAANVETIVPWLEMTFNFRIMPGDVYYITEIPSEIHLADIVLVAALALVLAVGATLYPSRRAAAVAPAAALRYERP